MPGLVLLTRRPCWEHVPVTELQALGDVLAEADRRLEAGLEAAPRTWPTGFQPLDTYLTGGLRSGQLTLVGGPQGLGKTTMVLQMLRNVVARGDAGVYFSFEHDAPTLLERFIALEAAEIAGSEALSLRRIREAMEGLVGIGGLAERLSGAIGGAEAVHVVQGYGQRLHLHRSNSASTSVATISEVTERVRRSVGRAPLVVVDYLQKVAAEEHLAEEEARIARVVEGLKDFALSADVPVVAVVAADREGLIGGRRLRVHQLRGAASLAYEADVILLLNDKFDVVARHHLVYDAARAERFRADLVVSIEKNRSGLDKIELEFRKHFDQGRLDPEGRAVDEQLLDDRIYVE